MVISYSRKDSRVFSENIFKHYLLNDSKDYGIYARFNSLEELHAFRVIADSLLDNFIIIESPNKISICKLTNDDIETYVNSELKYKDGCYELNQYMKAMRSGIPIYVEDLNTIMFSWNCSIFCWIKASDSRHAFYQFTLFKWSMNYGKQS